MLKIEQKPRLHNTLRNFRHKDQTAWLSATEAKLNDVSSLELTTGFVIFLEMIADNWILKRVKTFK